MVIRKVMAMKITDSEMFVHILHKLKSYTDAVVLDVVLHNVDENYQWKTTSHTLQRKSEDALSRSSTYRSLKKLESLGLIRVNFFQSHQTEITVQFQELNSFLFDDAVMDSLPGIRSKNHPFLELVNKHEIASEDI